jgi:ribonuclease G
LLWFRRKKQNDAEQAPAQAAAPATTTKPQEAPPAAAEATDAEAGPKRRRRGNRGGRNRKKPTGTSATAERKPAGESQAVATAEKSRPERKSSRNGGGGGERSQNAERRAQRSNSRQTRRRVPPKRAPLPAAKRELLISVDVSEQRVAVLEDGVVAEVYLERPEKRSIAGNIYLGTVDNVLPGMEAAFIEIGLEKNGFLYVDEIVVPELEGKARHGKRIQDLIQRGQTILVQAVKDPMKTKGARLTTEISLPGRFVVYVPSGEGLGVSRRLPDDERTRLKAILKRLEVKEGGVIVRTAAEGASAEDIELDLDFLQRLWATIQERAAAATAPELVYQEAELPLRVVRDLFTGDFERAIVDHDRTHKRIVGYLKKTSPHMVERVERHKEKERLFEAFGVDREIRSTLSRRVDLPSGGYLIFDYAEAFTVIDVNTGRFVGSRSKTSGARLEDTITKNNLEAVKEVVRQLRLRDIGGIIVIDFIDMANPKNRAQVEEALRTELERDRTKTYVVEISPLGLVEMTRQNVTDGPREIITRKCPTCEGDGVVVSETSHAVEVERKLRHLVAPGSRVQAFAVELHPKVASVLLGAGGTRLAALEEQTRRRFFLRPADGNGHVHLDHFAVVGEGKVDDLRPEAPVQEGQELELKLVELGRWDPASAVGKVDGFDVCVADAAKLVGKKVKVRVERVLDGTAYALVAAVDKAVAAPVTAEAEAEKPTRARRSKLSDEHPVIDAEAAEADADDTVEEDEAVEGEELTAEEAEHEARQQRKRTRRGSRGGRRRKKKPAEEGADGASADVEGEAEDEPPTGEAEPTGESQGAEPTQQLAAGADGAAQKPARRRARIHVPGAESDGDAADPEEAEAVADAGDEEAGTDADEAGDGSVTPKKRTRRGSRGGRRRKKPVAEGEVVGEADGVPDADDDAVEAVADAEPEPAEEPDEPEPAEPSERSGAEPPEEPIHDAEAEPEPEVDGDGAPDENWGYVPMSQWRDWESSR